HELAHVKELLVGQQAGRPSKHACESLLDAPQIRPPCHARRLARPPASVTSPSELRRGTATTRPDSASSWVSPVPREMPLPPTDTGCVEGQQTDCRGAP